MICLEDAVKLLAAVGRRWAEDARRDDHELTLLAAWLDMAPDDLRRKLTPAARCQYCGGPLPASKTKRRRFCSRACSWNAGNLRRAKPPI